MKAGKVLDVFNQMAAEDPVLAAELLKISALALVNVVGWIMLERNW